MSILQCTKGGRRESWNGMVGYRLWNCFMQNCDYLRSVGSRGPRASEAWGGLGLGAGNPRTPWHSLYETLPVLGVYRLIHVMRDSTDCCMYAFQIICGLPESKIRTFTAFKWSLFIVRGTSSLLHHKVHQMLPHVLLQWGNVGVGITFITVYARL